VTVDQTKQNIMIIGATSGIAEAVARRYAQVGTSFFLVARNEAKMQAMAADLIARGATAVRTYAWDAGATYSINDMLDAAWQALGNIDVALIAHGTLPDQKRSESDVSYALTEFRINAESVLGCLAGLAQRFEPQGKGVIAVIGSVAGDRGRASNYLYGAAKAAVDTYASGLRARLFRRGVHVLTIKPGFVATAMTAELNLQERMTVSPERVAKDIHRAILKRKDVLYTPWFWDWIMRIIRWIPTTIFKRLKF
jgi:decaprenylphospho-beta-D-erythro-pentofuranosid-2-ulose 2-reductase